MNNPYESPKADPANLNANYKYIGAIPLTVVLVLTFVLVSVGNEFAIFGAFHGYEYWELNWVLPASLRMAAALAPMGIVFAVFCASYCKWKHVRLPARTYLLPGVVAGPSLLLYCVFRNLNFDFGPLFLPSVIGLVLVQVILVCWIVKESRQGCFAIGGGVLFCGAAGATMGVIHFIAAVHVT